MCACMHVDKMNVYEKSYSNKLYRVTVKTGGAIDRGCYSTTNTSVSYAHVCVRMYRQAPAGTYVAILVRQSHS